MRNLRHRTVALSIAAVLGVFGPAMSATAAETSHASPTSTAPGSAEVGVLSAWQYNFYVDHFYSWETCDKRGYAMVNYDPDFVGKVMNYYCHKRPGDSRWSMDVLWIT